MRYIAWNDSGLYSYHSEAPDAMMRSYESFFPSNENLTEGFVVLLEYTTYDSFTSGSEVYRHIVDIYSDANKAEIAARELVKLSYHNYEREPAPEPLDEAGNVIKHIPTGSWGSTLQSVEVQFVKLDDITLYRKSFTKWN